MHIHLPWILAVGPNLKLKTGPKQLLAYLPLDIALPAQTGTRQVGQIGLVNRCARFNCQYFCSCLGL
jgi:hypothetical protein